MSGQLSERIDPAKLAQKQAVLRGEIPFSACQRVLEVALNPEGRVGLELAFTRENGLVRVRGWLETSVRMQCQRCLETVDLPVRCEVNLGVVASLDEADRLPEDCEPLLREGDALLALSELVEDEIILALPYIPRHPACGGQAESEHSARTDVTRNPFGVLAGLKG
jgi:uncharacterized protein